MINFFSHRNVFHDEQIHYSVGSGPRHCDHGKRYVSQYQTADSSDLSQNGQRLSS